MTSYRDAASRLFQIAPGWYKTHKKELRKPCAPAFPDRLTPFPIRAEQEDDYDEEITFGVVAVMLAAGNAAAATCGPRSFTHFREGNTRLGRNLGNRIAGFRINPHGGTT